ncbi:hypothetical protein RJ639_001013 [Escallonia herrerae]|uniref:ENTH domain-containing protein n=1 Tax=Escallonia herrerae TaxID=1293975 RepID=A0AA88XA85_9ASTE|nr:hypothetical protein RJ639_001013 [Escallonia herrerae]
MDSLHRTGDASVALKCLLTIHHVIRRGPFILQDQLSIFPASGGQNHLKLSAFHDGATPATWALSTWVRWFGRYLETLLSASRTLGFFLTSSSWTVEREKVEETISSIMNPDLIRDVDSLMRVIKEMCKAPDSLLLEGNKLLYEIMGLMGGDYLSAVNEVLLRLGEFKERLSCLSFGDSVELACCLNRLEDCKDRLLVLFTIKRPSIELLWGMTGELVDGVAMVKMYGEGGGKLVSLSRRERLSESSRFGDRNLKSSDSVQFSSGRLNLNRLSSLVLGAAECTVYKYSFVFNLFSQKEPISCSLPK